MTDVYTVGQIGIEFAGKLTDSDNMYLIKPLDLTGYNAVYVKFYRPDGTSFVETASVRDSSSLADTDIIFENDSTSVLDKRGDWSFTVGAKFTDGTIIESPDRELFWVV